MLNGIITISKTSTYYIEGDGKMSIFRTDKRNGVFVKVDKDFIVDKNLSWKAKGIYMNFLSLEQDQFDLYDIVHDKESKGGLETLMSGVKELVKHGYLVKEKTKSGIVYLIHDGYGNYKIGISNNLVARMISYSTAIPYLELTYYKRLSDYIEIEKYLHSYYMDSHIKGEWFKLTDNDILDIKKNLTKNYNKEG